MKTKQECRFFKRNISNNRKENKVTNKDTKEDYIHPLVLVAVETAQMEFLCRPVSLKEKEIKAINTSRQCINTKQLSEVGSSL